MRHGVQARRPCTGLSRSARLSPFHRLLDHLLWCSVITLLLCTVPTIMHVQHYLVIRLAVLQTDASVLCPGMPDPVAHPFLGPDHQYKPVNQQKTLSWLFPSQPIPMSAIFPTAVGPACALRGLLQGCRRAAPTHIVLAYFLFLLGWLKLVRRPPKGYFV